MRGSPSILLAGVATLTACAAPPAAPSLAPRSAEAIDPRVPIADLIISADASPQLLHQLETLVAQARSGDAAFRDAAAAAERLAAAAGAPRSESWIAAQQTMSAAQAARAPTTRAMADIDSLAARMLASRGGIAPGDLAAIQAAAAKVAAIDRSQVQRIDALQARLGR